MSDEENPASSSSPSTGQPTPPLAASGQQAGFADILQRNVIWAAFILVVAVVTATAAVFLFFEDRVKKQVAELVPQKVYEIYQSDQWGIRLHAAENEAIVSHNRAIAAQTNAQNSSANAKKMAGDAKRNADELQSRVTQ